MDNALKEGVLEQMACKLARAGGDHKFTKSRKYPLVSCVSVCFYLVYGENRNWTGRGRWPDPQGNKKKKTKRQREGEKTRTEGGNFTRSLLLRRLKAAHQRLRTA